jgi:hypothetical protein
MRLKRFTPHLLLALAWASLASSPAFAGRPLNVDDASVNEPGDGHIEAWYARQPDGVRVWTVAPAYGLWEGAELAGSMARDTTARITASSLQLKLRLTPSREDGCNFGAVAGASHADGQGRATPYVTGLASCHFSAGSLHLNLGASRPSGGPTLPAFGVAWEQDLGGVIAHAEWLTQRQSRPTLGIGLRKEIFRNVQLDGSVGRSGGQSLFSLGTKLQF